MLEHYLRILLLLAMWSAPLPFCAWLAARDRADQHYGHDLLAVLVGWIACQISVPLLLGSIGQLGAQGVYALEAMLLCSGLALLRLRPGRSLRLLPSQSADSWKLGFLFVAIVVAGLSFWAILRTPTSNYDSFAYHLPAMTWWAQHGSFEFLPELMHAAYYAFDWELASLLSVYPLQSDLFIAAPNLLAWAMCGLGIHLLARRLGSEFGAAATASLLLLTMFGLLTRLDAAQPDLVVAGFFVAAIYFGLRALEERSAWSSGMALLALAILPGLKMSGLVYAPMAAASIFALAWARGAGSLRPPLQLKIQLPLLLWGILLGSFWYARNFGLNGNPFGFLTIELFGREIFHGDQTRAELARTALLSVFDPRRADNWRILLQVLWTQLGPGFVLLCAAAISSLFLIRERIRWVLLLLGAWALFAYWSAPYSGDNGSRDYQFTAWFANGLRYAYPFFALLAVGAALGLRRLRVGSRVGLLLLMSCLLYTLIIQLKSPGLATRWSVGTALVVCTWLLWRERWRRRWIAPALLLVAFALLGWQSHGLDLARDSQRQKQYGFLHSYMEEKIGSDQIVGYARTHRRYQLFGRQLQREVVCVDARNESAEEWLRRIRQLGIDVLAVGTADNAEIARAGLPDVRVWIEQMPEEFELLFPAQSELKDLALYRLR